MELVAQDLIKTVTGIDVKERLNAPTSDVANHWIRRQENIILQHIAKYRYGGMKTVNRMLNNDFARKVIIDAVVEQVEYILTNKMVDPTLLMGITGKTGEIRAESKDAIMEYAVAPLAHDMLLNAGLLYCGEGLYDIF